MNQYMDQDCNTQSMALDHSTSVHSQASPTAGDNSYQDFQALHSILQDEEQLRQTADQKNSFTTMNVGINDFSDTNALSESLEQSALGPPRHQAHALSDFREPLSAPPRGRTQSKSTGRAGLAQLPSRKCVEAKCPRNFRPTAPGQEFCGRHQKKWERNNAAPLTFYMDLRINSFEAAHDQVYPRAGALHLDGDDLDTVRQHEHEWILRLLYAASKPYEGNSEFRNRQQKVYNGKGYNNLDANVRIRFLYKVALTFHEGGKAVYARGGDNGGYGKADVTLKLSERLMRIIHHMEKNKRVCMDVIEGRGVIALVENPDKYEKRKRQNKKSNKKKQKAQRRGLDGALEQDEHEGSDSDSDPSTDDDDSDHEEDCDAAASMTPGTIGQTSNFEPNQDPGSPVAKLPSGKRKRATRSTTTKAKAPKRLKKSVQGNETPPNDLLQNFDHNAPYDFGDSGLGGATNKNLGCDYNAAVAQQVGDTGGPVTRSRAGTGQTAFAHSMTALELLEMMAARHAHPPATVSPDLEHKDHSQADVVVDPSLEHDANMEILQSFGGDQQYETILPFAEPQSDFVGPNGQGSFPGNDTIVLDPYQFGFKSTPDSNIVSDPLDNVMGWE